jgi:Protein of unknown function (DUF1302)
MREALCGWNSRRHRTLKLLLLALCVAVPAGRPARASQKYGPLELSGNVESQNLVRHSSIDKYQFIQNRNTVRIRVDYDWLQKGKLIDRFEVPFIERSKLFILYRGVYDGFYDIAPTDLQHGQTREDDLVGGPIAGNDAGTLDPSGRLLPGLYSRYSAQTRSGIKFENTLREAYVDFKLKDAPLSFRIGRQQVIWGESDQFRLMDIWNPIDVTWHLQQESWDNIRIPLWLGKALWDIGEITLPGIGGTLSNSFVELVYNPFDFQPNQKLAFLPRPWSAFIPDPLRSGQVQQILPGSYATPVFNLQGTSFRRGNFSRNPQDASEVGVRFHAVTPQGLEFSTNYLYARARGVGAGAPQAVAIQAIGSPQAQRTQSFLLDGKTFFPATIPVTAEVKYPYNHIFGLTGNYFEGDYTAAVFRLETAYVLDEPVQTVDPRKTRLPPGNFVAYAPQTADKRSLWAGMIGFDRPTWIRFLNPKATWFLTAQFFWNYYPGNVSFLRGNSGAGETPYFEPGVGSPGHNTNGFGQWTTGPNAGLVERLQAASCVPGIPCLQPANQPDASGDIVHRWEHLITFAGTSFYRGGTVVPFVAAAWDPVDDNAEFLWNLDYFYTNNFIITLQQKFFTTYGSKYPSDDPWGAGGRNARRDETGVKVTYQF